MNNALPLSSAQLEIWEACQDRPEDPAFNMVSYLEVNGPVDPGALDIALRQTVTEAAGLGAGFVRVDDGPPQQLSLVDDWKFPLLDVSSEGDPAASALALMERRRNRPRDLASGPLFDFSLLRLAADQWIIYLGYHQLVLDPFGVELVIRRCAEIYAALMAGGTARPSTFGSFADYLAEDATYQGLSASGQRRHHLSDGRAGPLAPVRLTAPPPYLTHEVARRELRLPAADTDRLRCAVGPAGTRWPELLIPALAVYLARMRRADEISINVGLRGRATLLSQNVPTRAASVLPLRLSIRPGTAWAELGAEVGKAIGEPRLHQQYPGGNAPGTGRFSGPAVTMLPGRADVDFAGCPAIIRHLPTAPVNDLALCLQPTDDGGMAVHLDADTRCADPATLEDHRDRIAALLVAAAIDPDSAVRDAELLTGRDRERLLHDWNDTAADLPDLTVSALFDQQAARTPGAIAVEIGDVTLTYADLGTRSAHLARRLVDEGVRPEDRVAILMERSARLLVVLLAVARTGAAYVPLDPHWPAGRMLSILRGTGSRLLVVDQASRNHAVVASAQRTVLADELDTDHAAGSRRFPDAIPDAGALLYVMHTSGSTGEPKGVEVTHRNVIALALDRIWRGGSHKRVLFHSPHAFDASTYELWVPLLTGGRVVISPRDVDAVLLRKLISAGKVTALWLTAGLFSALAEGDPACLDGAREVWTGGDVVSARAVERIASACRHLTVFNGYGPTETTTFATRYQIYPGPLAEQAVSIGTPMDNTRIYVLDEDLRLLPPGAIGLLYVGGDGVARGYGGQPELTRERFVPDPFGSPGDRMYATGDLARWEADGNLSFLGRGDDQVKINGFRIEPGEIESVLARHPRVGQAAVIVAKSDDGQGRIVAYAAPARLSPAPDDWSVREYLAERLPGYMVPAEVIIMSEIPLTSHGKVDRRRLGGLSRPARGTGASVPATDPTPTQRELTELWTELMEVPVTSTDASFWELDGHSLLGVTLVARIRERLGVKIRLRDLFQHPRLGDLADFIDAALDTAAAAAGPSVAAERAELAASNFQERIWIAENLEPAQGIYNVPFAWSVSGQLDPERLALALARVIERHEALRTTFRSQRGELRQIIGAPWRPTVRLSSSDSADQLAKLLRAEADRPFDLACGPLLRAGIIETPDAQVLTMTVHHIVVDASSLAVLLSELTRYYADARSDGSAPPQYRDLLADSGPTDPGALGRRVQSLRGAPSRLPGTAAAQSQPHGAVALELPDDLLARMRPLQAQTGVSWFMVTATALALLLHRWTASDDLTFGFPADTRSGDQFAGVIGPCLNTVVVRSRCRPETTVAQLLLAIRDAVLDAFEDLDVPFGAIVDALNPPRSASSTPYLDVVIAPQVNSVIPTEIGGCALEPLNEPTGMTAIGKFAVTLSLTVTEDHMTGALLYRGDRLSPATAAALAGQFAVAIEAVLGRGDQAIAALDLGDDLRVVTEPVQPSHRGPAGPRAIPAAGVETRVAAIWSSLLGGGDIGAHDRFFDRGGNSLKLVTLHAELSRTFELDLPIQRLFENSTVRAMAQLIEKSGDPVPADESPGPDLDSRGAARRDRMQRQQDRR